MKGKVCLAYSDQLFAYCVFIEMLTKYVMGGLDAAYILRWLLDKGSEVVCFLANVG